MESFATSPASSRAFWVLVPVMVILVGAAGLLVHTALAGRGATVVIGPDSMRMPGVFGTRDVPRSILDVDQARIVDLNIDRGLRPKWRTMGTGLPGLSTGWFRLHNGEKALLHLTQRDRVVYLPTREGYSLLLSVEEPERLLRALGQEPGDG